MRLPFHFQSNLTDKMSEDIEEEDPDYLPAEVEGFKTSETSHFCAFCEFSTKTEVGLANHMKKHKGAVKYTCEDCEESFPNLHLLFRHSLKQHDGLKCNKCENRYLDRNCYRRHVKIEHEGLRYECKLCGKEFRNAEGLKNHRNIHLGIKPFLCDKCDSAFTNSACLRKHMKRMHTEKVCEVICIQCGKELGSEGELRKHLKQHEVENKSLCNECGEEFNSKDALSKHIKKQHEIKNKALCNECGEEFNSKDALSKHMKKQHEIENKTLCSDCGKEFNSKDALAKHIKKQHVDLPQVDASILREHLKDRVLSFANSHTVEETATKFNLNQTVVVKWLKIASRQFCCEFCSKAFSEKWRLERHQKEMHFSKEEWEERQGMKQVKLTVVPSLEEMYTKKYTNIGENHKIDQCYETTETIEEEVQEDLKDENDVKEEAEDDMPSPCPSPCSSPCPSPKQIPDEPELDLKEELYEPMFEDYQLESSDCIVDDVGGHRGEDADKDKIEPWKSKAKKIGINREAIQIFYCDLCEYQSPKLENVRNHMKKKHEGAVFICRHCVIRFRTRYDLKKHSVNDHNMLHLMNM